MNNNLSESNNLKKYGKVFQSKCIAILISDRAFIERTMDIISPDYFETDAHRWILKLTMEYFPKYRNIPTMEVFKVEIQKISDVVMSAAVFEAVKDAYQHVSASDSEYVKAQFLEFCKNQKLKNAIWAAQAYLNDGDYDSIWHVINEASRAGMERNLGHEYLSEVDLRHSDMSRETIKTNWDIIDTHLDGGLGKGELGFIVAPAGSGKSWFLTHLGAEAMRQGKNVMHFTMELNEKYVGLRYDSAFTGIAFQEVRKQTSDVKAKLDVLKSNGLGKLFVKYFPTKTASAATLKMHIDRVQLVTGLKIDLVIVDYADLLRPFMIEKGSSTYNDAGSVYEELRGALGELQVPGWTASQSNRGAHEEDIIEALDVADSYRKIMIGDFIMSLSRKMQDKIAGTGRIYVMKNRFGPDGIMYPCAFDSSCGSINIYDKKSIEGMEILNKAKSAQEGLKDLLRKGWGDTHHKKNNHSDSE
jgi:replicative DNA helicase